MNLLDMFRTSYEDRVDEAANKTGQAEADVAYHSSMCVFYESRVNQIDQGKDWWGFASVRQKLEDSRASLTIAMHAREEAEAKLEALIASRGDQK